MLLEAIVLRNLVLTETQVSADTELVRQIQTRLSELNWYPPHAIDGKWGAMTKKAIADFCKSAHLDNDKTGNFGASFAKALLNQKKSTSKYLVESDYRAAATAIGVSVAAVKAVVEVEAAGGGFFDNGKAKILFEAHWFDKLTNGKYRASHPNISSRTWNRKLYFGGKREYERLDKAMMLDRSAALMSASWGLGQVLGVNYHLCDYDSVEKFVADMQESEGKQLIAMCKFIQSNRLDQYLRKQDWNSFARGYNGNQYAVNKYHIKLANAYAKHSS